MKDKELNLVEILKDCPEGTELYTPMFGKVRLEKVDAKNKETPICVRLQNQGERFLTSDGRYSVDTDGECVLFPSKENRDWSTFKASKREHEFKPFERVLVRDLDDEKWHADFFSHLGHSSNNIIQFVCVGCWYKQCIPYEGNEYLLGTTDNPDKKGGEE